MNKDIHIFQPGDRFYYYDLGTKSKPGGMGTVIRKVFDGGDIIQLYVVTFDSNPDDERRISTQQMIPDYQQIRERKLNELGI